MFNVIGSSIPDDGSIHEVSMLELMNLVENSEYQIEIDTPDGFQPIGDFALKGVKPTFKIGLEDGTSVSCSKGHLIETKELIDRGYDNPNLLEEDRSYLKAKWLQAGDIIISRDGDKTVTSVEYRDHEEVYDIEVKHPNHRYYANGISHHNSGGKSTLAFQTALCACRDYPDQGVVYMDVEQHSDYTYLESLARKYGFDGVPKNLIILQPMSAEELEDTTGRFVNKMGDKIILLVIDSVAAAKPKSMLERKHGESGQKAEHAMFWNEFCPKLNNWAKKHNFAVLLINQLRAKPSISNMDKFSVGNVGVGAGASSFDNSFTATGGNALRFYLSVSYLLTWSSRVKEQIENEMTDEIEDIEVANKYTIKNIKNKVSRPFKKSKYIIRFGEGTDDISIIYDRLKDVGRITNKGSFLDYHAHNEDLNFRENGKLRFHEKFITEEILADAIIQYKESFKTHLSDASGSDTNDEIFDDDTNDEIFDDDANDEIFDDNINDATEL